MKKSELKTIWGFTKSLWLATFIFWGLKHLSIFLEGYFKINLTYVIGFLKYGFSDLFVVCYFLTGLVILSTVRNYFSKRVEE